MRSRWRRIGVLGLWSLGVGIAEAASIAGVCPDGSAFIVHRRQDVPCARAKLVPPSELPPLRPELLPRPYNWHVDQEARDPHNPYNLIDSAQKIRALRSGDSPRGPNPHPMATRSETPSRAAEPAPNPRAGLSEPELADLIRLVELRQRVAPATLSIDNLQGREQLEIQLAHSQAFEARLLPLLGHGPGERRVLLFTARSAVESEFHPNFLVVQEALTFRPEPARALEVGFLLGEPGPLAREAPALGYLVLPARFDPERAMDLWWNDRSFTTVLAPPG